MTKVAQLFSTALKNAILDVGDSTFNSYDDIVTDDMRWRAGCEKINEMSNLVFMQTVLEHVERLEQND